MTPVLSTKPGRFAIFILVVGMALALARLIPAFQSPDELMHLFRADMIAHGHLLLEKPPQGEHAIGGYADLQFIRFGSWMAKIAGGNKGGLSPEWLMDQAENYDWIHKTQFVDVVGTAYYVPLIYLPHAVGLAVSREFDWSMRTSYEFTRALVAMTVLGLLAWAWVLLPPNLLVRALVLMPMSAFQIVSPTIDGLCIAMALVLAGLVIAEYRGAEAERPAWRLPLVHALVFLLVTSRPNLLPLLALPLVLLLRRYSHARLGAWGALCAASLGWTLFVLLTTSETRLVRLHSTMEIVQIYLGDPLQFLSLVGRTLADRDKGYMLAYSFVGVLGWMDTFIPKAALQWIWWALGAALLWTGASTRSEPQDRTLRAAFLLCAIGSGLLAFFALAVTWNDYPAQLISGLQGRYFIIPALLLALSAGPVVEQRTLLQRRVEAGALAAIAIGCLLVLSNTLWDRYQLSMVW